MTSGTCRLRAAAAALLTMTVLVAACAGTARPSAPSATATAGTPSPTVIPSAVPSASPSTAPSASQTGAIRVVLTVATADTVTIDVSDGSRTLTKASSGAPGDGASVEPYKLVVANRTPTSVRLTWVGGPCDSANTLSIDAPRHRLLLVQPECPGDAVVNDRILDLEFSTPVKATDFETFLQDGLDTPA